MIHEKVHNCDFWLKSTAFKSVELIFHYYLFLEWVLSEEWSWCLIKVTYQFLMMMWVLVVLRNWLDEMVEKIEGNKFHLWHIIAAILVPILSGRELVKEKFQLLSEKFVKNCSSSACYKKFSNVIGNTEQGWNLL